MAQPTATNTPDNGGMVFDAAPVTAPTPASPAQGNDSGMVFDSAPVPQPSTPTAHTSTSDGSFLGNVGAGINKGFDESALGAEKLIRSTPLVGDFLGQHAGLDQQIAHDTPVANQPVQGVGGALGYGGESLGEFLLGDSALKSLAFSDRLLKASKAAKVIESSPRLQKVVQLGIQALRAGTTQGAIGLARTGDPTQAAEQGAVAGGLVGAVGAVSPTLAAIRGAFGADSIQQGLQDGIRDIVGKAATKAGVSAPDASTVPSIRDVVQNVSDSVRAKASALYSTLDEASGGRAQRFRDAAKNVSDKLGDIVGLDDEREAELVSRQQEIDKAHTAMLDELEAKGYPRDMLDRANAVWKQQSALNDLSASIRQSTSGLRPELAQTGKTVTPEAVNPKTLFVKVNRLNDRGRLADAIGTDNANALLQHVDEAYVKAQKIAATNKWAKYGLGAASSIGLGGVGYAGVHLAHELLGGQ